MKLVVDDREQLIEGTFVAVAPGAEQGRQFVIPGGGALVHREGWGGSVVYCRAGDCRLSRLPRAPPEPIRRTGSPDQARASPERAAASFRLLRAP